VSLEQARQSAVEAVFRLNRDVGIPRICATSGSVKRIFRRWRRRRLLMSVPGNPREASLEDIVTLYQAAW
jgi:lactaldehyde reductase